MTSAILGAAVFGNRQISPATQITSADAASWIVKRRESAFATVLKYDFDILGASHFRGLYR